MAGEKLNPRRVIEYQGSFYVETDGIDCHGCSFYDPHNEYEEYCTHNSKEFVGCSKKDVIFVEVKS